MTPEQFCYWLQGYYELTNDTDRLSQRDHIIRDHLNEVFEKRTPDRIIYPTTSPNIFPNGTGDYPNPNTHKIIC